MVYTQLLMMSDYCPVHKVENAVISGTKLVIPLKMPNLYLHEIQCTRITIFFTILLLIDAYVHQICHHSRE